MIQDPDFAKDVESLIHDKQKKSAFVYVKNHWLLIKNAIDSGSRIADIHHILLKNGIAITLATLRLYVHRLRHDNVTQNINTINKNTDLNDTHLNLYESKQLYDTHEVQVNKIDTAHDDIESKIYDVPNIKKIQAIRAQTPNLEELSKAFKVKK